MQSMINVIYMPKNALTAPLIELVILKKTVKNLDHRMI